MVHISSGLLPLGASSLCLIRPYPLNTEFPRHPFLQHSSGRYDIHRFAGGSLRAFTLITMALLVFVARAQGASAPACDLTAKDVRLAGPGCLRAWFDANLRINEIQTVGTAESYKLQPSKEMMSLIKMGSDAGAQALDYDEPSISAQLAAGARSLEFDVAYD